MASLMKNVSTQSRIYKKRIFALWSSRFPKQEHPVIIFKHIFHDSLLQLKAKSFNISYQIITRLESFHLLILLFNHKRSLFIVNFKSMLFLSVYNKVLTMLKHHKCSA